MERLLLFLLLALLRDSRNSSLALSSSLELDALQHQRWRDSARAKPPAESFAKREVGRGSDWTMGAQRCFRDVVDETINLLGEDYEGQRMLLHTRLENQDKIILINSTCEVQTLIEAGEYTKFMALSHLPVTAVAILLPNLLKYDCTLLANFSESKAFTQLQKFQESALKQLQGSMFTGTPNEEGQSILVDIVEELSLFVNHTLLDPTSVTKDSLQSFTKSLQPKLRGAAELAVMDYFKTLAAAINATVGDVTEDLNVVIAVEGFSYPGSFLALYYESLPGLSTSPTERIAFLQQPQCGTNGYPTDSDSSRKALSNATFSHAIGKIFNIPSVHSLLSEVAREIVGPRLKPHLAFKGFESAADRAYVILIVAFLSTTVVLLVVVLSVCCEDKEIRMERKPEASRKDPKDPSLLTPVVKKEFSSLYSSYHQLKKRHMQDGNGGNKTQSGGVQRENSRFGTNYVQLSDSESTFQGEDMSGSHAGPLAVTRDPTES